MSAELFGPTCSVVKGKSGAGWALPALLHSSPSACFSRLLGKEKKTGLPMDPGGQSRATEGSSSQKHNTFLWLLLADHVSCHQQLAWAELGLILTFFEKCQLVPTSVRPGVSGGSAWNLEWGPQARAQDMCPRGPWLLHTGRRVREGPTPYNVPRELGLG